MRKIDHIDRCDRLHEEGTFLSFSHRRRMARSGRMCPEGRTHHLLDVWNARIRNKNFISNFPVMNFSDLWLSRNIRKGSTLVPRISGLALAIVGAARASLTNAFLVSTACRSTVATVPVTLLHDVDFFDRDWTKVMLSVVQSGLECYSTKNYKQNKHLHVCNKKSLMEWNDESMDILFHRLNAWMIECAYCRIRFCSLWCIHQGKHSDD